MKDLKNIFIALLVSALTLWVLTEHKDEINKSLCASTEIEIHPES